MKQKREFLRGYKVINNSLTQDRDQHLIYKNIKRNHIDFLALFIITTNERGLIYYFLTLMTFEVY